MEPFKKYLPDKIGLNTNRKIALINNYDNGIVQADFIIKEVFKKLKEDGLLPNASIFILVDHGELFGENNTWGHGGNVHEKLLSIPWLIYDNELGWYNNLESATLKDVAPTIADRIGAPIPSCWEGISLHDPHPPRNFLIPIESVEKTELPYGILSKKDSVYQLEILDENKKSKRKVQLNKDTWEEVKQPLSKRELGLIPLFFIL